MAEELPVNTPAAPADPAQALEQILLALQFEKVCPGTFNFARCEELIRSALQTINHGSTH
jgi:hypothetical protein